MLNVHQLFFCRCLSSYFGCQKIILQQIFRRSSNKQYSLHSCMFTSLSQLYLKVSFAGNKILSSHFSFFNVKYIHACLSTKSFQSYLTLRTPMDYSLPGYSVHGILWARILEWVSRPSPWDLFDSGLNRLSCLLNSQVGALPLVPPRKPYMYTYIHICHLFTLVIKQSDDNPIFPCISCMFFLARCPIDVFPVILLPKALVSVILG